MLVYQVNLLLRVIWFLLLTTSKASRDGTECAEEAADKVFVTLDWIEVWAILLALWGSGQVILAGLNVLAKGPEAFDNRTTISLADKIHSLGLDLIN